METPRRAQKRGDLSTRSLISEQRNKEKEAKTFPLMMIQQSWAWLCSETSKRVKIFASSPIVCFFSTHQNLTLRFKAKNFLYTRAGERDELLVSDRFDESVGIPVYFGLFTRESDFLSLGMVKTRFSEIGLWIYPQLFCKQIIALLYWHFSILSDRCWKHMYRC